METGKILGKASAGNGQIRYGADVINRIIESQKENGIQKLQDAVIKETINPMIAQMCASAKIKTRQIYRMCVAGNSTMVSMPIRCVWSRIFLPFSKQIHCMPVIWVLRYIRMLILLLRLISEAM